MGLQFIDRVIKTTVILAVVAVIFGSVYYDWRESVGFLSGALWGAVNLYFLKSIIKSVITNEERNNNRTLIMAAIKFPVLYFIGYLILASEYFSALSLLAGFTLLFVVIILKVLGRVLLRLDTFGFENNQARKNS